MPQDLDSPDFHEAMEQAALLPGHDPVRTNIVQQVAACGGEEGPAGREWLSLLEESERLKLALHTVPVPEDLEGRLLNIPTQPSSTPLPFWQRPVGEILTLRRLAVAAAFMIMIAAGWWGYTTLTAYRTGEQVDRIALLAANIHTTTLKQVPVEHIDTADADVAQAWLKARVSFPALMLANRGAKLTGASVVQLGTATAALTWWERDGHKYSLLEFVPASVGLPPDFAKRTTDTTPRTPYKVVMWSEPNLGCGWALVMDPSAQNSFTY